MRRFLMGFTALVLAASGCGDDEVTGTGGSGATGATGGAGNTGNTGNMANGGGGMGGDTGGGGTGGIPGVCGDGSIDSGEGCDDGNTTSGDGCSASCTEEAGYSCEGEPSVCTLDPVCGNGELEGDEACDDGGTDPDDGCSATCEVETGWSCDGEPSVCTEDCGDGIIAGMEECDDADLDDGDGCSAACDIENGYTCDGEPSVCATTCSDGITAGLEECDDGDLIDGDGCSATCTIETGYDCDTAQEPAVCAPVCGDGLIIAPETCDDVNPDAGDGCSDVCLIEMGYACFGEPSECNLVPANPGDLVITEIMQNPTAVDDVFGEWFEIYNPTSTDFDLIGLVLSDAGSNSHTIATNVVVPAGTYAVLARNGDPAVNGGVTAAYVYSSFQLGNVDDEVILSNGATVIDEVVYDGGPNFPSPAGASMNLSANALEAIANDSGFNWCVSTDSFGAGDDGTPGLPNKECAPAAWTCNPIFYDADDGCECGCGATDPDCADDLVATCDFCDALGSCDSVGDCSLINPFDNAYCTGTTPAAWTCNVNFYDADDGCDCGCGVVDPDCATNTIGSCLYCGNTGSCSSTSCPGTIDPVQNDICL
jgi:cysteine-rich repeat protein